MKFISTRGGEKVTAAEAIVKGLADNGGLYVPEKLPKVSPEEMEKMTEMSYAERAAFILGKYFADELGEAFLLDARANGLLLKRVLLPPKASWIVRHTDSSETTLQQQKDCWNGKCKSLHHSHAAT